MHRMKRSLAVLVASLVLLGSAEVSAKPFAKRMFDENCARCHGVDGRGDGPEANKLQERPADLTLLQAQNGGQYPFERIYQTIDGRNEIAAHGARTMPVWGDYFTAQGIPAASYPGMTVEEAVFLRTVGLVYYIQGLQQASK